MSELPKPLEDILQELSDCEDQQLKIELLIELGEQFKEVTSDIAQRPFNEANRVPGCESEAFAFMTKNKDGLLNFHFAVENPQGISAKSLAYILSEGLKDSSKAEVLKLDESLAYDIFGTGLSMGKGVGLTSMIRSVKHLALT